jgi:hypothetical protein
LPPLAPLGPALGAARLARKRSAGHWSEGTTGMASFCSSRIPLLATPCWRVARFIEGIMQINHDLSAIDHL